MRRRISQRTRQIIHRPVQYDVLIANTGIYTFARCTAFNNNVCSVTLTLFFHSNFLPYLFPSFYWSTMIRGRRCNRKYEQWFLGLNDLWFLFKYFLLSSRFNTSRSDRKQNLLLSNISIELLRIWAADKYKNY